MNNDILQTAAKLYQFKTENISFLGGFENFVYEASKLGQDYIIRFVHSKHRPHNQVLAEIEFIDYLAQNQASVSTVVHSVNESIVENITIDSNNYFTVSVFEKAPGIYVPNEVMTPDFWTMFGTKVGRLHRLSKVFSPKHKRPHWYQEDFEGIAERALEDDDAQIITALQEIKQTILTFPSNHDNYGLIHSDLHFHNMYYDNGSLTFFDFDDATYKHFISDIAIVIYYNFSHKVVGQNKLSKLEYNTQVRDILEWFMAGYNTQNTLAKEELLRLNDFLQLRAVILYIVLVAAGYKHHEDEQYRKFCRDAKDRALNKKMQLDLDIVLQGL